MFNIKLNNSNYTHIFLTSDTASAILVLTSNTKPKTLGYNQVIVLLWWSTWSTVHLIKTKNNHIARHYVVPVIPVLTLPLSIPVYDISSFNPFSRCCGLRFLEEELHLKLKLLLSPISKLSTNSLENIIGILKHIV